MLQPAFSTFALFGWMCTASLMAGLWAVQRRIGNAGIVDVGWAAAVAALSGTYAVCGTGYAPRRVAIGAIVGLWGVRLASYLLIDRVLGRPEDGRYTAMRAESGARAGPRFFWFFQAQAVVAVFFSLPAMIASLDATPRLRPLEGAAVIAWAMAFAAESAADRSLARFKADPAHRGQTCRAGWWRYSRHPNYFFEWLIWVTYALFALQSPWGFLAVACPAAMLYLLFRVTGVPAAEAQAVRSRGDEYRRYQQITSVFVPWWPARTNREAGTSWDTR